MEYVHAPQMAAPPEWNSWPVSGVVQSPAVAAPAPISISRSKNEDGVLTSTFVRLD